MDQKAKTLAYENTVNERYVTNIDNKPIHKVAGGSLRQPEFGPLAGRVSLEGETKGTLDHYYFGPRHVSIDGLYVISWAAPAAEMFFKKSKKWRAQKIRARRRFLNRVERLTDFADEWAIRPDGDPFPASSERVQAQVSPAGPAGKSWLAKARSENASDVAASRVEDRKPERLLQGTGGAGTYEPVGMQKTETRGPEDLLKVVLAAPRTGSLASVLPTLQPEQYGLVTWKPDRPLVVQGHAGTGKTIIATHRAAWLVDSARGEPALRDVLLLGPTQAWEEHVSTAVTELHGNEGAVAISSIQSFLADILGLAPSPLNQARSNEPLQLPARAEAIIAALISRWKTSGQGGGLEAAYRAVLTLPLAEMKVRSKEFDTWRSSLPTAYVEARADPSLCPLLAYIKTLVEHPHRYSHLIVDEAQDLTSCEWLVLKAVNAGGWTLVGDMNQRQGQKTFKRWGDLAKWLATTRWTEHTINSGFRTTQSISEFAATLLPLTLRRRTASPLGRGKPPVVLSVEERRRTMESIALEECRRLAADYQEGTVAVISPNLGALLQEARAAGWTPEGRRTYIESNGGRFQVFSPEEARGLEFDAVIVMEPAAFRASTGTNGRLYTSLTRANLELVVVHDKPLPAALARAAQKLRSRN